MKIEFSLSQNRPDLYWVDNIATLDIICSSGEAEEIIVDDILSQYSQYELGSVIEKILDKLKFGGSIVFYITDIELLAHSLANEYISVHDFNVVLIQKPIKSCLSTATLIDIIKKLGVKIQTKQLKNYTSIITGVYNG